MVFSSLVFLCIFLPIVFLGHTILPGIRAKNAMLLLASLVFYAYGEPVYVVLMVASALCNYLFALWIERFQDQKKWIVSVAVILNLALLVIFKYAGFLTESVNTMFGTGFPVPDIRLPIGISFFTFQAMSYVIDVYRWANKAQKNFGKVLLYISFFPQLIAGPIVKYHDVEQEIEHRTQSADGVARGIRRFIAGLSKKVLISNVMGMTADALFGAAVGTLGAATAWVGALSYLFQIYFDFSGYSDMAIGLGKILGFTFPENFRYPFISKSISEFWRRWHMTLGGWFRDYLYIPLGGNRVSVLRWCFNMFVVWLLSGLWHGAGWNFALWGLYFGVFLSAEKLIGKKWKERSFKIADISANNDRNGGDRENMFLTCVRNIIEHGYVLLVVLFSFVIFRVESVREIKEQFLGLAGSYGNAMTPMAAYEIKSYLILLLIACAGATPFPAMWVQRLKNTNMWKKSGWLLQSCYILTGLVLATAFLLGSSVHPFLYFRF